VSHDYTIIFRQLTALQKRNVTNQWLWLFTKNWRAGRITH
jgi:hypothetical protein